MVKEEEKGRTWTEGEKTFVAGEDGVAYELVGYGAMKDYPLDLDPRIDLTQPIWDQAKKLAELDRAEEELAQAALEPSAS